MVRFLISRPIAVFMAFTAFFILGIITYYNVPVSLLPDIDVPEITVQVSGNNVSARELENTVVSPLRSRLMQVGRLRDIHSETRDGLSSVLLKFEYGTDIDLSFIEVNEKIDDAMNGMPDGIDRPRVIKASASDVPALNLNLTLKGDKHDDQDFLDLSVFAENVIKRRIEQLPEVAMVDMTGLMHKQVSVVPKENVLAVNNISLSEIESALNNNNIEPTSMMIKDGYYEYNVRFSSVLRTIDDIKNIYIRKNGTIFQLKNLADVKYTPQKEKGVSLFKNKRSVSLSVIKQNTANMEDMRQTLNNTIRRLKRDYPDINIDITEDQTELLNFTISNLRQNLFLAFIFICIVSLLFMKDIKSPVVICFSIFVSIVISLLFFYLFNISFNVVSLTGLILALGMMIDNSIIVTDNITQYRKKNYTLDESCVKGTNEVIGPMLSSSLTTISVFFPLIFMSGIAGAIFFDQAFSVTVGLLVSYVTGIMFLPVLYNLVNKINIKIFRDVEGEVKLMTVLEDSYHKGVGFVFNHKKFFICLVILVFPLCYAVFSLIHKEKLPDIKQSELLISIDWNENIHVEENKDRTLDILNYINAIDKTALIGQNQYILNKDKNFTSGESEIYAKVKDFDEIEKLKKSVSDYMNKKYPVAIIKYSAPGTVFEKIFSTSEPDIVVEYYTRNKGKSPEMFEISSLRDNLIKKSGFTPLETAYQQQLNITIDRNKLILYKVSYDDIYRILRTAFKENNFSTLRSYQQYFPIVLGDNKKNVEDILNNELVTVVKGNNGKLQKVALRNFVNVVPSYDLKTIEAGKTGEYIPMKFYDCDNPEAICKAAEETVDNNKRWNMELSGAYFSNKKMIGEMVVILLVSLLLMYFILASQFENFIQPLIVLLEIPIDISFTLLILYLTGNTLNLMSAIGLIVTCGIVINDSILKLDVINKLRAKGTPLVDAIHIAGRRRLKAILLTSLTTIVCMLPILFTTDLGSELEKPLAVAVIAGMIIGTLVSLFIIPFIYYIIYYKKDVVYEK